MKVVIVEDEIAASENLEYIIKSINPDIEVLAVIDSVSDAIDYFTKGTEAVLAFMDIHLADGISFEIFDQVKINIPIIFTTAYDKYAIQAFKVNSLDYLLKPISAEEVEIALEKFNESVGKELDVEKQLEGVLTLLQNSNTRFKTSYLIQRRDELIPIKIEEIAYFHIDTGVVKLLTFEKKEYSIQKKLELIEMELNPKKFFRLNRQFIVNKNAIEKLKFHFNGKLIVELNPAPQERVIVSKNKANEVKQWLNT